MNKTAIIVPYFGGLDYEHLQCMNALKWCGHQSLKFHELPHCPWIDMAQAFLVDRALEDENVDIVFSIEHDMLFEVKDVLEMAERCRNSEYDMLAAAYCQRRPGGFIIGGVAGAKYFADGVYPNDHCGLGFTAMKRSLFEKLRESLTQVYCPAVDHKIYPYFAHIIGDMYLGQDASFCKRINNAGMKIGIDVKPRVYHRGNYNYALEDAAIRVPRYETLVVNEAENTK